jgi:hypothetical protein
MRREVCLFNIGIGVLFARINISKKLQTANLKDVQHVNLCGKFNWLGITSAILIFKSTNFLHRSRSTN